MKSTLLMGFVGLSALALTAVTTDANAQDKVRWKMQSAFGSQLPHLGTSGVRFAKNVERLSGGKLEIKFYEPGALIPPLECFDAVAKGSIESCWTTPGYHTGKYPALAFFTTVPFGPPIGEFLGWKWFGGGNQLRNEIYAKHGLFAIDSFAIAPETSGWFRNEIKSIEELKGLKMRFFGLGAQVMQKLGVSTQLMAAADIYPALERGVIDATEFSMPTMDTKLGFHQIAKFNYFPGWHQQTSVSELLMNKAAWDALSDQNKAIIEIALGESIMHTTSRATTPSSRRWPRCATSTRFRSSAGATKTWPRWRRPGWKCWRRNRPRTRCSRRSPTTTWTTARSSRFGVRRRR